MKQCSDLIQSDGRYNPGAPTSHNEEIVTSTSVHLDAVRGLAALAVMTFHLKGFFFSSISDAQQASRDEGQETVAHTSISAPPGARRSDMGNTPVMMFFVLSGYLVGGSVLKSLKRGRWSTGMYMAKRLTRLWVVLIPALLFGVVLDSLGPRMFGVPGNVYIAHIAYVYPHSMQDLRLSTVLGNVFFLQGIFVTTPGTNGALWSLSNEFWYYILFPMMMVPILLRRPLWVRICSTLFVVGFLAFVSARSETSYLKHIALLFPIWLLGALLSMLPLRVPKPARNVLTVIMIVIVLVGTITLRRVDVGVRASQYTISLLFTGLLYLLLHYPEKARNGLYKSIAGFFSRISYSLYLIHMPLGAFLAAWLLWPWHLRAKTPTNFMLYLGFCGIVVLITYVFYLAFEANTDRIRKFVMREGVETAAARDDGDRQLQSLGHM
jgi:peptidoglycan/LPS O-acetylase OafA/YrhL